MKYERFKVSQTHLYQEDVKENIWYVIDTKSKTRFGYGFTDFTSESSAREFATWLNSAYELGYNAATNTIVCTA